MDPQSPRNLAHAWWQAIDRADFTAAVQLMTPDAVVEWPLSNERITSPEHWRLVNEHYPGRWSASVRSVVAEGETVVTVTEISDGPISVEAMSFFTVREGTITSWSTGRSLTPRPRVDPNGRSRSGKHGLIEQGIRHG